MAEPYCPDRGDLIWLSFDPQAGHEQAGRRPALVLSPRRYNRKIGLAICCPVTSKIKKHAFEVLLPEGLGISGAILADQVKSLDWKVRQATRGGTVPAEVLSEALGKLRAILEG